MRQFDERKTTTREKIWCGAFGFNAPCPHKGRDARTRAERAHKGRNRPQLQNVAVICSHSKFRVKKHRAKIAVLLYPYISFVSFYVATGGERGGSAPQKTRRQKAPPLSEAMDIVPRGRTLKEETQQSVEKLTATSVTPCGGNLSQAFERACMVRAGTVRAWRNTASEPARSWTPSTES